jgi:hypothetical protein
MDKFLEDIRQTEQAWSIKTTRDYVGSRKIEPPQPLASKIFKPSIVFKLFALFFLAIIPAIVSIKIIKQKGLTNSEIGGLIAGSIGLAIIVPQLLRQAFYDKERNFTIRIDHIGISIDDTSYPWDTMYETAIMTKTGGSSRYYYLVIALKNLSTYEPYKLSNFLSSSPFGFAMTLAKYIEYFKPKMKTTLSS